MSHRAVVTVLLPHEIHYGTPLPVVGARAVLVCTSSGQSAEGIGFPGFRVKNDPYEEALERALVKLTSICDASHDLEGGRGAA